MFWVDSQQPFPLHIIKYYSSRWSTKVIPRSACWGVIRHQLLDTKTFDRLDLCAQGTNRTITQMRECYKALARRLAPPRASRRTSPQYHRLTPRRGHGSVIPILQVPPLHSLPAVLLAPTSPARESPLTPRAGPGRLTLILPLLLGALRVSLARRMRRPAGLYARIVLP